MSTNEQEKFNAWWDLKGTNSVILRAQAWSAWLARAEVDHPQPDENPDEWVIQDMVPPRFGLDQWKWVGHDERTNDVAWKSENGNFTRYMHGFEAHGETLHVRCRRRDLPKVEQAVCDECGGSGEVDSGGFTPWMAPISVPCGKCSQPEPHRILGDPAGGVTMQKQCAVGCHGPRCPNPALPGKDHCSECADEEPQPQKTRVRLWKNAYGSVMSNPDCENIEGWREIRVDSEGFYTEG